MSIAIVITLWVPYFVEEQRVNDLNEEFYSDLRDIYNGEYKSNEPFVFNPSFNVGDTSYIKDDTVGFYTNFTNYDTNTTYRPDSLDVNPLKYDSTIVVIDDKRLTFKSVTQYIGDLASSFNKVVTLIISLINIPVAYRHYKEKKKNESK